MTHSLLNLLDNKKDIFTPEIGMYLIDPSKIETEIINYICSHDGEVIALLKGDHSGRSHFVFFDHKNKLTIEHGIKLNTDYHCTYAAPFYGELSDKWKEACDGYYDYNANRRVLNDHIIVYVHKDAHGGGIDDFTKNIKSRNEG